MGIEVKGISRTFGKFVALNDISFTVADGELVALLGPSGCGKTTLLRIIAGLEVADRGVGAVRRRRCHEAAAGRAARRLRLPALRALPPHDRCSRTSPSACASAPRPTGRPTPRFPGRSTSSSSSCSWTISAIGSRASSPADSGSASRWRGPWRSSRRCCSSTSRSARSTPRSGRSCAAGCAGCTTRFT